MYEKRISHEPLKSYRVICASTEEDVESKVAYQIQRWEDLWRRLVRAKAIWDKTKLRIHCRDTGENIAASCTKQIEREMTAIEKFLPTILSHGYTRDWSTVELNRIIHSWVSQARRGSGELSNASAGNSRDDEAEEFSGSDDPMYEDALRVVLEMGRASTSTLQRRLRLVYGRSARILDRMQRDGIIGEPNGSTPCVVLRKPSWLDSGGRGNGDRQGLEPPDAHTASRNEAGSELPAICEDCQRKRERYEGAMKGILVTTSGFGPDAYAFARGKPLTLLGGSELLYLLDKHGHRSRIDLNEAKTRVVP
jgi:hypothetical protein